MAKANDITELRDHLLEAFELLRHDPKRMIQVKELSNAAGKVINTVRAQLEYSLMRGEQPEIPFMGKATGKAITSGSSKKLLTE